MPSRKRGQGQARRARAGRGDGGGQSTSDRDLRQRGGERALSCSHGADIVPPEGHACLGFLYTIEDGGRARKYTDAFTATRIAAEKYPEVWNDGTNRKIVKALLLSCGTEALLRDHCDKMKTLGQRGCQSNTLDSVKEFLEEGDCRFSGAMAISILLLENYDPCFNKSYVALFRTNEDCQKCHRIIDGCQRTVIRFFSERIPCSCLDRKRAEVKESQPRKGLCNHCAQKKDLGTLKDCGKCRMMQYCSKECQVADWPKHKDWCKRFCKMYGGTNA